MVTYLVELSTWSRSYIILSNLIDFGPVTKSAESERRPDKLEIGSFSFAGGKWAEGHRPRFTIAVTVDPIYGQGRLGSVNKDFFTFCGTISTVQVTWWWFFSFSVVGR